jgi:hypothetical protein
LPEKSLGTDQVALTEGLDAGEMDEVEEVEGSEVVVLEEGREEKTGSEEEAGTSVTVDVSSTVWVTVVGAAVCVAVMVTNSVSIEI